MLALRCNGGPDGMKRSVVEVPRGMWLSAARAVFVLGVTLGLGPTVAAQTATQACTTVAALPAYLAAPGRYCLDRDLVWEDRGPALIVTSSDVQIDLGGHRLRATRVGDPTTIGISASADRLQVRNGTIDGFFWGAMLNGRDVLVEGLQIVRTGYVALIVRGDGGRILGNRVIETGIAPEACSECTIPIGISATGSNIVVANNLVAETLPVLESVGIATTHSPNALVTGNVITNSVRWPNTWATWLSGPTSELRVVGNWLGGYESGLTYSHVREGGYEANTFFDITNRIVVGAPRFTVLDQGGNRVATGTEALPLLQVVPATVTETEGYVDIEVRLSTPVPWKVEVRWRTRDGSAQAGPDYRAATGTLSFFPGERSRTFRVQVNSDTQSEGDEEFYVDLTNPIRALVAASSAVTVFDASCVPPGSTSLTFEAEGGTQRIPTSSTCPGSAVATEPWIGLTLADLGVAAVDVSVAAYDGDADRLGSVGRPGGAASVQQRGLGPPLPATLLRPDGLVRQIAPRLEWTPSERTQDYVVEVRDNDDQLVFHEATEAALACEPPEGGDPECGLVTAFQVPLESTRQPLSWRVRSRNDAGLGDWSTSAEVSLAEPDPLEPITNGTDSRPLFRWEALEDATEYRIWLADDGGVVLLDAWFGAEHCDASTCEVSSPLALDPGAYVWWVQARSPLATGAWSRRADFEILPAPTVSVSDAVVTEGDTGESEAVVEVRLSQTAGWPVSVPWSTRNVEAVSGSDYTAGSGVVEFAPGETLQVIRIAVLGDDLFEIDERLAVELSIATGATRGISSARVTILNDDSITATVTATPGIAAPGSTLGVNILGGPGYRADWVGLFPVGATNRAYVDWWYLNGQHTAPATGLSAASFSIVAPTPEGAYELRFFLNNSYTFAGRSEVFLVADLPVVSISGVMVTEGDAGDSEAVVEVRLSHAAGWPVSVPWSTRDVEAVSGLDYTAGSGVVEFAPGETLREVRIAVHGDVGLEVNERLAVDLSAATGGTLGVASAYVTILNDDSSTATVTATPGLVSPGSVVTASVSGGPGYPTDWVGLYAVGAGDRAFIQWWYLNGQRTAPATGLSAASFPIVAPALEGEYELRFFLNNGYTFAGRSPVLLVADLPVVSVSGVMTEEDAEAVMRFSAGRRFKNEFEGLRPPVNPAARGGAAQPEAAGALLRRRAPGLAAPTGGPTP